MPNYPGRRKGTRRIVLWHANRRREWVVRGTKADGDAFEARKRIEINAHVHETRVAPTFERLAVDKYSPFAEGALARTTWRARKHILVGLRDFFGEKKIDAITTANVDAYRALRVRESSLSESSLNTEVMTLLYVLRWAKDRGYPVNVPKVKFAKPPRGRVRIWTPDQVSRLLSVTRSHDPWLLPMLVFLVNTGCRKGEAIAAEWSWIDFAAGYVRIPATREWKPKSGRAREIPMADEVRAALSGERRSDRWVFPNRDGVGFEYFPDARFKALQTAAGVTGGAHTLRHVYASAFLQAQPDMFLLGQILGHTTQRVTELYSHLLPEHLEKARNAVNIGAPIVAVAGGDPPKRAGKGG